jgi:hypothetical protein
MSAKLALTPVISPNIRLMGQAARARFRTFSKPNAQQRTTIGSAAIPSIMTILSRADELLKYPALRPRDKLRGAASKLSALM